MLSSFMVDSGEHLLITTLLTCTARTSILAYMLRSKYGRMARPNILRDEQKQDGTFKKLRVEKKDEENETAMDCYSAFCNQSKHKYS